PFACSPSPPFSDPTMPATAPALDAVHIGNGHAPALPEHLTAERLRALARVATYAPGEVAPGEVASGARARLTVRAPFPGEAVAPGAVASGARARLTVRASFTGEAVATLPAAAPEDVAHAFARARAAQAAWAARPFHARARVFERYPDLVPVRREEALDLIQLESGKTRFDAFLEVGDVALVARYYAYHGEAPLARTAKPGFVPALTQVEVNRVPVGVVGVIAPWNYPLTMAISDAIPALVAGNGAVVKPAEQTPFTALWAAELLYEAGLPRDLLHVVPGDGPTLGPALIGAADFVHFTGSTEVGRLVARQAG